MNKNEWKKWTGAVGRMLLAFALILAQGAWAGQNQTPKDKLDSLHKAAVQQAGEKPSSPAESRASSRGTHEGIKVHGHWTIEVRNPDGTVVTHREFENSLGNGVNSLAAVLSRGGSVGFWKIQLNDPNGTANAIGPCINSVNAKPIDCEIIEPAWASVQGAQSFQFPTLTVSTSGANAAQLVLSGTAVASVSDSIASVATLLNTCPATVAPSNACATTSQFLFTFAGVLPNVNVTAGQTIAATVTISFS